MIYYAVLATEDGDISLIFSPFDMVFHQLIVVQELVGQGKCCRVSECLYAESKIVLLRRGLSKRERGPGKSFQSHRITSALPFHSVLHSATQMSQTGNYM